MDPDLEVELVEGRYGEYTVLADGEELVSAGVLAVLGVVPSIARIREAIAARRASGGPVRGDPHQ
jgi:hypothetical protein